MVTTVIFDLDDTLYDEIEYCKSGFAAVAKFLTPRYVRLPKEQIYGIFWKLFNTGNHTTTFNAALDELEISYDENLIAEMVGVYHNHIPDIKLPQDSQDVLNRLSSKYILALITDGYLPAQRLKIQALGIESYFKSIIYTEELGRDFWKPSPTAFQKILHELKIRPENTVYIADNEKKDFIAPNRLGMLTIQLIRPAGIHTLESSEPDSSAKHIIHQISTLPALLEEF
ncbi:MAG: HAD-IA family hydrolase [Sedimentisphaerales bacterium]|nr:HAD-IA family hydrolase [Sedimentisphaerales bacterium]